MGNLSGDGHLPPRVRHRWAWTVPFLVLAVSQILMLLRSPSGDGIPLVLTACAIGLAGVVLLVPVRVVRDEWRARRLVDAVERAGAPRPLLVRRTKELVAFLDAVDETFALSERPYPPPYMAVTLDDGRVGFWEDLQHPAEVCSIELSQVKDVAPGVARLKMSTERAIDLTLDSDLRTSIVVMEWRHWLGVHVAGAHAFAAALREISAAAELDTDTPQPTGSRP